MSTATPIPSAAGSPASHSSTSPTSVASSPTMADYYRIERNKDRYPYCIVWTPIPLLTWLLPVIGHMGIALSNGVIRDFAGPYFVSEDNMAFGHPTKYWPMTPVQGWDAAITAASQIYSKRMHNLCCDNCHSHVATALNLMNYRERSNWNMVRLACLMLVHGKYVNFRGFVKTWLPFLVIISAVTILTIMLKNQ